MLKKLIYGTVFLLTVPAAGQAGQFDLSFSDKTAQLALSQLVADYANSRSFLGLRGLYNDREETELLSLSYDVLGPISSTGLEIGAGARAYYANSGLDNQKIGAGGVGVLLRFVPPTLPMAGFSGSFYLCPEVFSSIDGEGLWDAEITASFEIAERASVFASYTRIKADFENIDERNLDKSFRVGLILGF